METEQGHYTESVIISQKVIPYLLSLGYPYIETGVQSVPGTRERTIDLVVYLDKQRSKPHIVVEVKRRLSSDLTLLDPAVQQAFVNASGLGELVRYLLITDGTKHYWFERSDEGRSLVQLHSPPEISWQFYQPTMLELPLTQVTDARQFWQIIESVADALVQDGLKIGLRAAIQLNRILIAKLYDEQTTEHGEPYRFSWRGEPDELVAQNIRQLYVEAIEKLGGMATKHSAWSVSPEAVTRAVQILEPFALTSVSAGVRGRVFWRMFTPSLSKGEMEYASPSGLAEFLVQLVEPIYGERILDPACGTGLFLVEVFHNMEARLSAEDETTRDLAKERQDARSRIVGIEVNPDVAELAASNLALNSLPPSQIIKANSLDSSGLRQAGVQWNTFDVVLVDPPLGSLPLDQWRGDEFEVAYAGTRIRLELAFIEQALKLLRPGGRAAILLPDSILSSPSYRGARDWLLRNAQLRAIISFPPETFAPIGHSGKASVLMLRKQSTLAGGNSSVFVADVRSVGHDRFGKPTTENELPQVVEAFRTFERTAEVEAEGGKLRVWRVPLSELDSQRLDVSWFDPSGQQLVNTIERGEYPVARLRDIASIISGRNFKRYIDQGNDAALVIQAGAVRDLELDLSNCPHISFKDYQKAARAHVQAGDVLVTTTGSYLGRAAVAESLPDWSVASGAVTIVRIQPGSEVDAFFLAAILSSGIGKEQVAHLQAAATAQPYIRRSDLGEVLIPLPPLGEQKRLAARVREVLDKARDLYRRAAQLESEAMEMVPQQVLGVGNDD